MRDRENKYRNLYKEYYYIFTENSIKPQFYSKVLQIYIQKILLMEQPQCCCSLRSLIIKCVAGKQVGTCIFSGVIVRPLINYYMSIYR